MKNLGSVGHAFKVAESVAMEDGPGVCDVSFPDGGGVLEIGGGHSALIFHSLYEFGVLGDTNVNVEDVLEVLISVQGKIPVGAVSRKETLSRGVRQEINVLPELLKEEGIVNVIKENAEDKSKVTESLVDVAKGLPLPTAFRSGSGY